MEDEEIIQLRELKEKLLKNAIQLRDQLKIQEENGRQSSINFNTMLPFDDEDYKPSESLSTKYKVKLCEIASNVTGIAFKNVNKKWLHSDVYVYTATVITKTLSFNLELTVVFKDLDDFEVDDIMCYFIGVNDCYMLEISSWFQKITSAKNFSLLMSAFSDYNENNILRSKILHSLESKKYASVEQCTKENGGVLVHLHSPTNTEINYVTFQWAMKFLELTWHIEHFFTIKSTDIGIGFSEENFAFLKKFCKAGLTKDKLVELWDSLCIAIDAYHTRNTRDA